MTKGHFVAFTIVFSLAAACGAGGKATNSAEKSPSGGGQSDQAPAIENPIAAACMNGIAKSCLSAASSSTDPLKARELYDQACKLEEPLGCLYAGQLWAEAEPADLTTAMGRFEDGCRLKEATACYGGGLVAAGLFGGEPRPKVAAEFHRRGCNLDLADACTSLGQMLLDGEGVEQDESRGLELLTAACQAGEGGACIVLGGRAATSDEAAAREFYQKACDAGDGQGCMLVARSTDDAAERQMLFEKGCTAEVPDPVSCTYAAIPKFEGDSPEAAVAVFEQTCGLGEAMGCFLMALAHADGRGVEADAASSATYLDKACAEEPARCDAFRREFAERTKE